MEQNEQTIPTNTIDNFEGVELVEGAVPEKQAAAPVVEPEEKTFDEETYVKGLGFESVESAKAANTELVELRKLKETAQTPAEIKFANEASQKFFDYLKEGKEEDVFNYLSEKTKITKLSAADVTKLDQAAEVIKLNMALKNKDLTADEVAFQFSEDFSIPEKPEQDEDETEESFEKRENRWKKEVERVEKRMVIAAKQAKPELAKYQSELVLPDIQRIDPKAQEAAQKELDDAEADKAQYLAKLNGEFKNFNGYNATFKDTEVEMAIGYSVGEEEKAALKTQLESFAQTGYSGFFGEIWFDKDGVPDIKRIVEDVYLLKNKEKVFQKMVNEAASKRMDLYLKSKSNIQINEPTKTFQPEAVDAKEKELAYLMEA